MLHKNFLSQAIHIALSSVLLLSLTACGSSEDRARASMDMHHHHHHDNHNHHNENVDNEIEQGRLFITEKDNNKAYVYSLAQNKIIQTEELPHKISALYSSPNGKYALAINRKQNLVNFYDSGLIVEDHGDHVHTYANKVKKIPFQLNYIAPTHYEINNNQAGLFFDGIGKEGNPINGAKEHAGFALISDDYISNGVIPYQQLKTNMHGGAEARGDYIISSVRLENTDNSLGDGVAIYHRHNDHFHFYQKLNDKCPNLHGSASSGRFSVFACSDGVLSIYQKGDKFTSQKIAYPDYFQGLSSCNGRSARIGSFANNIHQPFFIATVCGQPQIINPITQQISNITWTNDNSRQVISYNFDASGNYILLLDNLGKITILDTQQDFKFIKSLDAINSDIASGHNRPRLINNPNTGLIYLLNPTQKSISVIDPQNASLKPAIQLDFIPEQITWFGFKNK